MKLSRPGEDERVEVRCDLVLPFAMGGGVGALLREASLIGDTALVRVLLEEGRVNPREADENATTPLHMATKGGHVDVADLLQKAGASPTTKNAIHEFAYMTLKYAARALHGVT